VTVLRRSSSIDGSDSVQSSILRHSSAWLAWPPVSHIWNQALAVASGPRSCAGTLQAPGMVLSEQSEIALASHPGLDFGA
jgi:hypothetical protein